MSPVLFQEEEAMVRSGQMSESIKLGAVLAISGGGMDAYSYMCRGRVFANAQTGNILLLGVRLSEGRYAAALRYLLPVIAFAAGIAIADSVRKHRKERRAVHWRQTAVLAEVLVLAAVSFLPQSLNFAANSLLSLACGIQVESFRKIHGNGVATTMCIGNLRSATEYMGEYWSTKNKESLYKSLIYYGIILCFVLGAVLVNVCVKVMKEKAILICAIILLAAFVMMFADGDEQDKILK